MINLRVLSIAVAVCLGMLGAVQLAAPESLGISPVAARWLGIVAAGLGILQGFLPRVQGPTTDPLELADRVMGLSHEDRSIMIGEVERRAVGEAVAHAAVARQATAAGERVGPPPSPSTPPGPPPPPPPLPDIHHDVPRSTL